MTPEPRPEPEPELEPLVQPTAAQVTDRLRVAFDRAPSSLPVRTDHHERGRIRAAMSSARRMYPEPVARVLCNELMSWDEFGYRWARPGIISPLIDHLLQPAPVETDAA
jgi:hypothetical protein